MGDLADRGRRRWPSSPRRRRCARSIEIDPLAALTRASPQDLADPRAAVGVLHGGGPLDAADPHRAGPRGDLRAAGDPVDRDVAGTGLDVRRTRPRRAGRRPTPSLQRTSPIRPPPGAPRRPASTSMRDPTGRPITTSIELPAAARQPSAPAARRLDQQVPFAYSTTVCSAAATSDPLAGSLGRTSTVVSVRSVASIRMSPDAELQLTVIGSGVSNVVIGSPPASAHRAQPV